MLAAALAAGCAQQPLITFDAALAVVPFEVRSGGRIVIDVAINDQGPYRFAVDTAATASFLVSRVREDLDLEPLPGVTATVQGIVASGSFPVVDIERLAIGRAIWANARLIDLPGVTDATASIDGILGADFLRRYSIGFSSRERNLQLFTPETTGANTYRDWAAIPIEPRYVGAAPEPLHFLDVTIAGHRIPALLDLGAGISVLNPAAAQDLQLSTVRPEDAGELSGAVGNESVIAQLSSQIVRTGRVRWRNEIFLITDLSIFEVLQSQDAPLAILGSGLFNQRDFIIDFARHRLLVRSGMSEIEE